MTGIAKHWEKVVLIAALALALVFLLPSLLGGQAATELAPEQPALKINETNSAYTVDYAAAIAEAKTPAPASLPRNAFANTWLQYCTACRALQPRWVVTCPECGATVSYREDTDNDGIPNSWERMYGLDWTDPKDGVEDPDKDEFSNIDEFKRNSNPTNPVDPNVILDEYRLVSVYRPARPIMFKSKMGTPATGVTLSFVYKGKGEYKKEGEEIKDGATPVYKIGKLTEKLVKEWKPEWKRTTDVDRSEVALTDLKNSTQFVLVLNLTNYEPHVEVKLVRKSANQDVIVRIGDALSLSNLNATAKVTALDEASQTATFTRETKYKTTITYQVGPGN